MVHTLKTYPEYFFDIIRGIKQFEFRLNDRNFTKGDLLCLIEFDPELKVKTGKFVMADVLAVYELFPFNEAFKNYVCMSIQIR